MNINLNDLNCIAPHCKEEWTDESVYSSFDDDEFLRSIHVYSSYSCCVCGYNYCKIDLDYIDNTCETCGAKICEDCMKKIIQGQFCRCHFCGLRIVNKFENYHICDCGEIICDDEHFCSACKKINTCLSVEVFVEIQDDHDFKSLRSDDFDRKWKSHQKKKLKYYH